MLIKDGKVTMMRLFVGFLFSFLLFFHAQQSFAHHCQQNGHCIPNQGTYYCLDHVSIDDPRYEDACLLEVSKPILVFDEGHEDCNVLPIWNGSGGKPTVLGQAYYENNYAVVSYVYPYQIDCGEPVTGQNFGWHNGDGITDIILYRSSTKEWFMRLARNTDGSFSETIWSVTFGDLEEITLSLVADFNGDRKADIAYWRKTDAKLFIKINTGNETSVQFDTELIEYGMGIPGEEQLVLPGDFNEDGVEDVVLWRPKDRLWTFYFSLPDKRTFALGPSFVFGLPEQYEIPVTGDFNGDGNTDVGLYRPLDQNRWFIKYASADGMVYSDPLEIGFGITSAYDMPIIGDYNGDRRSDLGLFRTSENGEWHIKYAKNTGYGFDDTIITFGFGLMGDFPVGGYEDKDYDGIIDGKDNCRTTRNTEQKDTDNDGSGDVCDTCPNLYNPDQRGGRICRGMKK